MDPSQNTITLESLKELRTQMTHPDERSSLEIQNHYLKLDLLNASIEVEELRKFRIQIQTILKAVDDLRASFKSSNAWMSTYELTLPAEPAVLTRALRVYADSLRTRHNLRVARQECSRWTHHLFVGVGVVAVGVQLLCWVF